MTEQEARDILRAFFKKWLGPGHEIWIGDVFSHDHTGYSFEAGTYSPEEGKPDGFPIWGVEATSHKVGLDLVQRA